MALTSSLSLMAGGRRPTAARGLSLLRCLPTLSSSSSLLNRFSGRLSLIQQCDDTGGMVAAGSCFPRHQRRHKMFPFQVDLQDPAAALERVQERLNMLREKRRMDTTEYLYNLLNLALCHYNLKDLMKARKAAHNAHQEALRLRDHRHTVIYFTSVTCAQCAKGLREHLEAVHEERRRDSVSDTLNPSQGRAMDTHHYVQKLRGEERSFTAIAQRLYNAPDKEYMRSRGGTQRQQWSGFRDDNPGVGNDDDDVRKGKSGKRRRRDHEERFKGMRESAVGSFGNRKMHR